MKKVKYLGVYTGASYFSYLTEYVMAFSSLAEAREAFRDFYDGHVRYDEYRENADGLYVLWERNKHSDTPGASEDDVLYVYAATADDEGYLKEEYASFQISFGKRMGIRTEQM